MKTFSAVGLSGHSGLATAYSRHVRALGECANVHVSYYKEPLTMSDFGYVHGPASMVIEVEKRPYNIAYLVCETQELGSVYSVAASKCDEIWTCSNFCKEALSELGPTVSLVPHYVEEQLFTVWDNEKPTVLIMFDGFSRILRKNPAAALQVIKQSGVDVNVIVKASNLRPVFKSWLMQEAKGLNVEWIEDKLDDNEMQLLYSRSDIFLSLHTSEGFGLPILEAMSHGKKVIATGWGGNMDYMNEKNSYIVDFKLVDVEDSYFFGEWARPDIDSGIEALRSAVRDFEVLEVNEAAYEKSKEFCFENTVKATKAAL